ncbi:EPIDERMAL PATTERNING FACTOR-like protein 6 [Magnolia sinica]|uniref:EPIDERMAL PATTERNING FACTOR-like protein 6 n=1 Tax=Magnolia sinica TaxID=86752 RepID=UPI0026583184|nr:EPIDERMAL PATTERNING FACTOR-like protein 6 [Magnolia sinica]
MWAEQSRSWSFLITIFLVMSLVPATSGPSTLVSPGHGALLASEQGWKSTKQVDGKKMEGRVARVEEEAKKVMSKLGSRPPSCDHKCGECNPCEAIQVPTTTDHVTLHYANYEPEGWKCKCGSSFFNP